MKLATIRAHVARIEDGAWVDDIPGFGDLRLKVRGIGSRQARDLQQEAVARIPEDQKVDGALTEDHRVAIASEVILGALLLDWQNLTGDSDDDVIDYSPEMAARLVNAPDLAAFRAAIIWAASNVGKAGPGESVRDIVHGKVAP